MKAIEFWTDVVLLVALAILIVMILLFSRDADRRLRSEGDEAGSEKASRRRGWHGRLLRQAGLSTLFATVAYWAAKLFFALLTPLALAEFLTGLGLHRTWGWFSLWAVIVGFLVPDVWVLRRRGVRRRKIRSVLSYFMDLTVALLRSGMTLDKAFLKAGTDGFRLRHPLAEELRLLAREIDIGKERGMAFSDLADRTGVNDLRSISAAVRMGLQTGAAVEETLQAQADIMRAKMREQTLKRINSVTVYALFPVLLCGLPIFIVIVYFPAFLKMLELMRGFKGG